MFLDACASRRRKARARGGEAARLPPIREDEPYSLPHHRTVFLFEEDWAESGPTLLDYRVVECIPVEPAGGASLRDLGAGALRAGAHSPSQSQSWCAFLRAQFTPRLGVSLMETCAVL